MIVLSESPTDLTTPLRPPRLLNWFDSLSAGRCTLPQLSRWVLEACRRDPGAAEGVLLLLEEYAEAGKLKQFDFGPLRRELQRRSRMAHGHTEEATGPVEAPSEPAPRIRQFARDPDPTQMMPPMADESGADAIEPVLGQPPPLPASETEAAQASAPAAKSPTAVAGVPVGPTTVLRDRYVLQDEIGRGGVGTVYRALDRNRAGLPHDQQFVALKVVREEHARSPETLHALRREFHQAQSLSHPGIVNVFDFDHDGETYFVTMELLDGEPLGALMRRSLPHPVAREKANRILRELGDAVVYAHARDVLHMDLKPGNVMVGSDGHVRVLDFGLAQTFMAEPWISDVVVPPAATPAYASCERLVGDLPDVRDDIFSFSCLAYELLGGKHPFDRGSALEARNSGRKPRRIRGLSSRQWRTLKRGLAWSREDRPASMQELLGGLELPAATARLSARRRARSRPAVPSARWPVGALLVLALLGAAVIGWNYAPSDLRATVSEQAVAAGLLLGETADAVRERVATLTTQSSDEQDAVPVPVARPPEAQPVVPPELLSPARSETPPPSETDVALAAPDVAPNTGSPPDTVALTFQPPAVAAAPATSTPPSAATPPAPEGPGRLEFASDTVNVSEADAIARVSVRRRGDAAGQVSFTWRTIDDSAVAGEDYAGGEFRETMAAGQRTATLLIPLVGDSVAENTELLDVVIEDASGARLGSLVRVPVVIIDDD
jgi:serine/threonine protein kinase